MRLSEQMKNQIVEALRPLDPEKIILFGSYAYGEPTNDSDIDLYVVTKDDFVPQSWTEKSQVYLRHAQRLDDISKTIGLDLITHTRPMHKKFIEMDGMFCRKILNDGVRLYESID